MMSLLNTLKAILSQLYQFQLSEIDIIPSLHLQRVPMMYPQFLSTSAGVERPFNLSRDICHCL
ncbi:hypothetical protein BDV24DRAFT_170607 [Aspergillus arachidicola]|uniref:Uncharacterized protein n=1 Tax=Aspergillus arachidicola TaxID=656916 RepID=A0A5N6XR56_9EURO|nr:hypothetical protein BDV24DRAFT_170607 [Aspergillus arachidicola]